MSTLEYIIIFSVLGGVVSLIGGVLLLAKEEFSQKISGGLAAFAAGALLAAAFTDLLPEAVSQAGHMIEEVGEHGEGETHVFLFALFGVLFFYVLERFIHWFHHHGHEHETSAPKPTVALVILGDTVHNFIDGVVIAATFMVDINLGIVTTVAVAAHEIPQEIGDFGILLHMGMKRSKILFYNFISALMAVVGALLTYILGGQIEGFLPGLLAVTAGFFIYIAAADIIPHLHENRKDLALKETVLLFLGVGVIYAFSLIVPHIH